jgi:hypothetical protein
MQRYLVSRSGLYVTKLVLLDIEKLFCNYSSQMAKEYCIKKINRLINNLITDFSTDEFPEVCAITHYQFAQMFYCGNEDWELSHFIQVASAQVANVEFRKKCIPMVDFRNVWELFVSTYESQKECNNSTIGGVDMNILTAIPPMIDFIRGEPFPFPIQGSSNTQM